MGDEFRLNKRIEQKKLLYDTFHKRFSSYLIDDLYYFFYENDYDDYVDDGDDTVDHYRNDYHILYGIICDNNKNKKVVKILAQSSYDFMTDRHDTHSYESHTTSPHISIFSFNKFFACNQKHTCYNCDSFNITSIYYNKRNRNHKKIYIRDDMCHNCGKDIQHMSCKPFHNRRLTFQNEFILLYNEECKRRFYDSYFTKTVLEELLLVAMNPSRIDWILDTEQKTLWNI